MPGRGARRGQPGGHRVPGVTSALPLARRAVALIARQEALEPNPDFDPIRHGIRRFADMTDEERAAAIAENPDYGEIFCRCEKVTKAEILQAIHNPWASTPSTASRCAPVPPWAAARAATARPASPRPSTGSWGGLQGHPPGAGGLLDVHRVSERREPV
ncbi:hypothetical protein M5E87_11980 [Flavonifractor plautii]|nr:hypothetical protein M5E87_11980 [Flavonifractor plautii]